MKERYLSDGTRVCKHETKGCIVKVYGNGMEVYFKKNASGRKAEEVYEKLIKEKEDEQQQLNAVRESNAALKGLRKYFKFRSHARVRDNAAGKSDFRT